MTQAADAELWALAAAGTPEAFGELYERHARAVYNYCFRRTADWALAEDLTSVVFLEAWRKRESVAFEGESLRPWLLGVATNVLRSRWRSQRRYRAALARLPLERGEGFADEAVAHVDDERRMRAALRVLGRLPRRDQEVFALCELAELTYVEAAVALAPLEGERTPALSRLGRTGLGRRCRPGTGGITNMTLTLTAPAERDLPRGRLEARRRHLVAEISTTGGPRAIRYRRSWLLPAGGLAAAAAAAAIAVVGVGGNGGETASAATVLRQAAAVARQQDAAPEPGPGEYVYVRSVNAYLTVFPEDSFAALVPRVREIWQGPEGGRIRETSSEPIFLSPRDRDRWIAAGRPKLREPVTVTGLEPSPPLQLPDDADALYERLERQAAGHPEGVHEEMFVLVGDALRETAATPAQRAALYEVAARIPGVQLLGEVTDPAGRRGIAVAMEHRVDGMLETLVFDPETSMLLAEEQRTLADNEFDYPKDTVIGYATYHDVAIVGSNYERP